MNAAKQVLSRRLPINTYSRIKHIHRQSTINAKAQPQSWEPDVSWEAVIGLEIHAQIASKSKLFSGSATEFAAPINSQVSLFDASLPGTLPVLNKRSVEAGVLSSLALGCSVNKISRFDRKHYFYADLPQGYQITQQRQPLAVDGHVRFLVNDARISKHPFERSVRITQLQLEQDSGKSLHDAEAGHSLIDLNRAGVGLMEIVTEPDFRSGEEAAAFVKEIQLILCMLGTCDGKMAEGSLRVDANISVRHPGQPLGVRSEVKNINSGRYVAKAIEFEIKRQIDILESGGKVINETRSFDFDIGETVAMRDKERLQDYRYMPEPNLPPLRLYTNEDTPAHGVPSDQVVNIDALRGQLPELPHSRRERLQKQYDVSAHQSMFIVSTEGMQDYFERAVSFLEGPSKGLTQVLLTDVMADLYQRDLAIDQCPLKPETLAEIFNFEHKGIISKAATKKIAGLILADPSKSPADIIRENDLELITDEIEIEKLIDDILTANEDKVALYKSGKKKVLKAITRTVFDSLNGRVASHLVNKTLQKRLS